MLLALSHTLFVSLLQESKYITFKKNSIVYFYNLLVYYRRTPQRTWGPPPVIPIFLCTRQVSAIRFPLQSFAVAKKRTHPAGIFYQLFKWNGTAGGIRCRKAFCGQTCCMDEHRKVSLHISSTTFPTLMKCWKTMFINTLFLQANILKMFRRVLCYSQKDC